MSNSKKRIALQQKQRETKQQKKQQKAKRQEHDPDKWEAKKAAKAQARYEQTGRL